MKEKMMTPGTFTTVYIGNLDYDRNKFDIKDLFSRYGKVLEVSVVKDPDTKKSKGIAFVKMPVQKEAMAAINGLNGLRYDNRTLKVSVANDRFLKYPDKKPASMKATEEVTKVKKEKIERAPVKRKKKGLAGLKEYLASKK